MNFKQPGAAIAIAAILAFALALLAGCQLLTFDLSRIEARIVSGADGDRSVAQFPAGQGLLRLAIRWPAGYRAQALPTSTAQLSISITKDGSPVGILTSGGSPASNPYVVNAGQGSVTVRLRAATGLAVAVSAIPGSNAPSGASGNCAAGFIAYGATTADIRSSNDTSATVSLSSCYTPAISGLSPSSGNAGDTVTISGTNLLAAWAAAPTVTFNGVQANIAADPAPSATSLVVTVPTGGTGGNVVVSSDGFSSGGVAFAAAETCPAGQYASGGSCATCPAGSYNPNTGATSVADCLTTPAGAYTAEGASQPAYCPAGTYNPFTGSTSIGDCQTTPAGAYTSAGSSQPTYCPAGTYNPDTGATSITQCQVTPAGAYTSQEGASQPTYCPPDTFNPDTGATSPAQCQACPGGTTAPQGSAQCS